MSRIFGFGESVDGYAVPVLNEREVRASAGILFFFAMAAFMNAWLLGDFRQTRIFVIAFLAMVVSVGRHLAESVTVSAAIKPPAATAAAGSECTPPDWVVAIGHAEKWKLHHNCR